MTEAVALDPGMQSAYAARAVIYSSLGKDAAADDDAQLAIDLGADPDLVRNALNAVRGQR